MLLYNQPGPKWQNGLFEATNIAESGQSLSNLQDPNTIADFTLKKISDFFFKF